MDSTTQEAPPYTVTELNREVRLWLEQGLGMVAVSGEISNLSRPASGHLYFTLKDAEAQLRCVFFRNYQDKNSLNFKAGQEVIARGSLSLYEARGDYQLIVQGLRESGLGALYQQFERLKAKLEQAGLFANERKRPLPRFCQTIAVITSETGAALQDILCTLLRRYPLAEVHVYPSEVQGKNAAQQLVRAIQEANKDQKADVILLARGGGSLEDLWPFNEETLAYAIFHSRIPIVSGVGHETDFSIADFVADLRAATPTAAAEAVTPHQAELLALLRNYEERLFGAMHKLKEKLKLLLSHAMAQIASPRQLIYKHWQTLDYLERNMEQSVQFYMKQREHRLQLALGALNSQDPASLLPQYQIQVAHKIQALYHQTLKKLQTLQHSFSQGLASLDALSPSATLRRGYAIATNEKKAIIYRSDEVHIGENIHLQLAKGRVFCQVRAKEDE